MNGAAKPKQAVLQRIADFVESIDRNAVGVRRIKSPEFCIFELGSL